MAASHAGRPPPAASASSAKRRGVRCGQPLRPGVVYCRVMPVALVASWSGNKVRMPRAALNTRVSAAQQRPGRPSLALVLASQGACVRAAAAQADPELTGWAGLVKHRTPWQDPARSGYTCLSGWLAPTPPLGARVKAEEPGHRRTRAPGRLSLGDRLTPVPALRTQPEVPCSKAFTAAVPAVSAAYSRLGSLKGRHPHPHPRSGAAPCLLPTTCSWKGAFPIPRTAEF